MADRPARLDRRFVLCPDHGRAAAHMSRFKSPEAPGAWRRDFREPEATAWGDYEGGIIRWKGGLCGTCLRPCAFAPRLTLRPPRPNTACDDTCRLAVGQSCACPCGGANHGLAIWLPEAMVQAAQENGLGGASAP